MIITEEIIKRIGMAFLMSLAFGLHRQLTSKASSFGTFIFVSVGACGMAIAAVMLNENNPLPLLGAIITGVGFLGAGALIKTGDRITGFTTAASIWVFAVIGMLIGVGRYIVAGALYALVWGVLLIDRYLSWRGIGTYSSRIRITAVRLLSEEELTDLLGTNRFEEILSEYDKKTKTAVIELSVRWSMRDAAPGPARILASPLVKSLRIE